MSEIELKSCPMCGGEAKINCNKTVYVGCTHCTCCTFQRLSDKESAIRNWNNRQPDQRVIEKIEALTTLGVGNSADVPLDKVIKILKEVGE